MSSLHGRLHRQTLLTVLPVLLLLLLIALTAGVPAQTRGTETDARKLLDKAALHLRQHGVAAAAGAFADRDGALIDRDLYPVLIDRDGMVVAHGWTPSLNGENMLEVRDADGQPFIREALAVAQAQGEGAVTYKWADPLSGQIARKTMLVRRVDVQGVPYALSVGIYR